MTVPLKSLFFDVGQTICFADFNAILAPLHTRGISVSDELWTRTLRETKPILDRQLQHKDLNTPDQSYWQMFYEHLLAALGVNDLSLQQDLVKRVRQSRNWNQPKPGTREVLLRLGQRYRLGVISNADGHIEEMLRQCGLADCFLNFTDSGLVGVEKPDPLIFHIAFERMGCAAAESLYVGDIYSVDYQGATAVGMQSVLLDAAGVYRETDYPRVETLEELEVWLEAQG